MAEANNNGKQTMEKLTLRYRDLDRKKITAETNLRNSTETLEKLKAEAREKYQTDDIEELRKKLAEMLAENERLRAEYQQHLDEIEANLAKVEIEFQTASEEKKT